MFWVVQDNIFEEHQHDVLLHALESRNIPYSEVKVIPFYDKLLPSHFDSNLYQGAIDEIEEEFIDNSGLVMVSGSLALGRIANERGWNPGSFLNDNFHYNNWLNAYGNHLLNHESVIDTFQQINPPWDTFFIRPCKDNKDFNGTVHTQESFNAWREDELSRHCEFKTSEVVASPFIPLQAEYRFFVVDGKVITYSQYKKDFCLFKSADVPFDVIAFAQKMVDKWQPARAFVIDIATTPHGLKVIEINNFNSAGFYLADVEKIVEAIEEMIY